MPQSKVQFKKVIMHKLAFCAKDTYSHIISGMQEDMMVLLDEVIPSGVGRKSEKEASI